MNLLCDNIKMLLEKGVGKMGKEKEIEKQDKNNLDKDKLDKKELKEKKKKEKEEALTEKKKKKTVNKNTQEYLDKMLVRRKRIFVISIVCIILLFVLAIALTAFSITASLNNKIINGVTINGIDVSGLTVKEAEEKINKQIEETKVEELQLEYEDFETAISREDLNINFDVNEAANAAYNIGRDNNIISNNFKIIKTRFSKENIEINTSYNTEMLDSIITDISQNLPGLVRDYTYYIEEDELIITRGTAGIALDEENLRNIILDRFAGNILNKDESVITIPVIEKEPADIDIEKIYEEVHTEPQDAYIIEDPLEIVVDQDGIDFDITIEEAKELIESEYKEEYIIPLKITKAKKTVKDLGAKAFPDRLSRYSTKYDASNRNRSTNLELAAEKINGTVLLPGEEFSYNKVVGKRTIENGYKEAAVFANGGVEDGLGGGICQISTTLYNAVLLANLEITERRNHTYVTSYEDPGRDATVVYGVQDFKFKNSREYPIKIEASVKNGVAMMTIMGIEEEVEYEVKIRAYRTGTIPYKTEERENSDLAEGKEKVIQSGANGCKAVCYRDLYLDGKKVSSELLSNDTYSAMTRIVEVGTKKSNKKDTSSSSNKKNEEDKKEEEKEEEPAKEEETPSTEETPEDTETVE